MFCMRILFRKKIQCCQTHSQKISCGPGVKEIIKVPSNHICTWCNKEFSTNVILKNHMIISCKKKEIALEQENKMLKEENKFLKETIKYMTEKLEKSEKINSIKQNVNNYENTTSEKLIDRDYGEIINSAKECYNLIPLLITKIHINPDIPENHNIFISNRTRNNKYIQVYNNGQWESRDKEQEIGNLINDKVNILKDWVDMNKDKHKKTSSKADKFLKEMFVDENLRYVKEEIVNILYNNRDMIKTPKTR